MSLEVEFIMVVLCSSVCLFVFVVASQQHHPVKRYCDQCRERNHFAVALRRFIVDVWALCLQQAKSKRLERCVIRYISIFHNSYYNHGMKQSHVSLILCSSNQEDILH